MKSEADNEPKLQKFSRRNFIKATAFAAGAMGVAVSIGAGGLGTARLTHAEKKANGGAGMTPFKIDVHHHSVDDEIRQMVYRDNALKLFPRFA